MTDLVERLRDGHITFEADRKLMEEAADEIERLEALIVKIDKQREQFFYEAKAANDTIAALRLRP
jgi:hypothetical protein